MQSEFERSARLFGEEAMERLSKKKVLLFGLGGVGGACFEALVRGGIGFFTVADGDVVDISNMNRQILFTHQDIGRAKVAVAAARAKSINPSVVVEEKHIFYLPENDGGINFADYDYVVDAIDTVAAKLDIIKRSKELQIPIISAMGCGNKVDPGQLKIADIYKTDVCPLARVMRAKLRKMGIDSLKVVYSTEPPIKQARPDGEKRTLPGSSSFVPPAAGYLMASAVIRDLIEP